VEMGGVEPPSRTFSGSYATCVVALLSAASDAERQAAFAVSQTVFGVVALANLHTASTFVAPRPGSRRNRSGETRYLEVSDLGSVGELTVVISWFARFYEASGASAREEQTYGPVETKHPQNRP